MKNIYCPKCGGEVPGLEGDGFHQYALVYGKPVQSVKDYRSNYNTSLAETPMKDLYRPAPEKYCAFTLQIKVLSNAYQNCHRNIICFAPFWSGFATLLKILH
jgi:hypothetical protein